MIYHIYSSLIDCSLNVNYPTYGTRYLSSNEGLYEIANNIAATKTRKNCQHENKLVCILGLTVRTEKWKEKEKQTKQLIGQFFQAARITFCSENNMNITKELIFTKAISDEGINQ